MMYEEISLYDDGDVYIAATEECSTQGETPLQALVRLYETAGWDGE